MSEAATPTTRIQGCIYLPSAVTIRYTHDPTGAAMTSDFAIAAGTLYQSHDAFLTAWHNQLEADLGMFAPTVEVASIGGGVGFVTFTTGGLNFSVNWSFGGDGTTLRNYLGFSGNITNQPSGYGDLPTQAAFYPTSAAQVLARSSARRPRSQMVTLSGASRSQHGRSPADALEVELDVELRFGPSNPHTAQSYFETYFLNGLETYSSERHFTLLHGVSRYFVRFVAGDGALRLRAERVDAAWDSLWRLPFKVATVSA